MKDRSTYQWGGQVTVFALLVFMLVVSVLASQYKSALFYASYTDAVHAAQLSADAFLATYQKALRDRYGILAVDAGYGQTLFAQEQIENQLLGVFTKNMQGTLINGQIESFELSDDPIYTWLIDGDWSLFLREIKLNQKETVWIEGMEWIIDQWFTQNDKAENELTEKKKEADEVQEELQESTKDEMNEQPATVQDPRDLLMTIWRQGILYAACPSGYDVSEKTVSTTDVSYPVKDASVMGTIDFKNESSMLQLFDQWKNILQPEKFVDGLSETAAVQSYIYSYFQSATKPLADEEPHALNYEVEYLIGGKESDSENLKVVLWKLIALRCVFNLSYLMTSPEKNQQVLATAGALSAAFLVPQFTEVIAFILKMAWAFAESLSDCRRLLNGGKIPMMKDDGSWHLTWNQMLSLNEGMLDLNENSMGWDYDTYLQVFLLIEESDTICRRMTHVIEKNIRLMSGYEGFRMKNCVYGILVKYTCDFKSFGIHEVQTALSY